MEGPLQEREGESKPHSTQATAVDVESDQAVKSAVQFLSDTRVRRSSVQQKVSFLKSKGLSGEQIHRAFELAGSPMPLERINAVQSPPPLPRTSSTGTATAATRASALEARPPPRTAVSHTLFPQVPPPLPEAEAKRVDWRDVVIGAGAAATAAVAAVKLFNKFSPYEFRRRPDKRQQLGPYAGSRRRGGRLSSGSETDRSLQPPLPQAPLAREAPPPSHDEELKRLQGELEETKEALANERKRSADLAISAAKLRGEKQQLSRTNEKLSKEVDNLKERVEQLERTEDKPLEVVGDNVGDLDAGGVENLFPKPLTDEAKEAQAEPTSPPNTDHSPLVEAVQPGATSSETNCNALPEPTTVEGDAPSAPAPAQ